MKTTEPESRHELAPADRALAEALRQTLEQSARTPDTALDAALAATRAQVRELAAQPRRRHRGWLLAGGVALAASLAVVVILPDARRPTGSGVSVVNLAAVPPVALDPQLLEDMDLLLALDAPANGS